MQTNTLRTAEEWPRQRTSSKKWHAHWQVELKVLEQEKCGESVEPRNNRKRWLLQGVGALKRAAAVCESTTKGICQIGSCGRILTLLHKVEMVVV